MRKNICGVELKIFEKLTSWKTVLQNRTRVKHFEWKSDLHQWKTGQKLLYFENRQTCKNWRFWWSKLSHIFVFGIKIFHSKVDFSETTQFQNLTRCINVIRKMTNCRNINNFSKIPLNFNVLTVKFYCQQWKQFCVLCRKKRHCLFWL